MSKSSAVSETQEPRVQASGSEQRTSMWPYVLMVFVTQLEFGAALAVFPAVSRTFGVSFSNVLWFIGVYALGMAVSVLAVAPLSVKYGAKRVVLIDAALWIIGCLVVAIAPNYVLVLLGRLLQGIGASGVLVIASKVAFERAGDNQQGRKMSVIGMVSGVALVVAPLVCGALLVKADAWRMFYKAVPLLMLVVFALAWWRLDSGTGSARNQDGRDGNDGRAGHDVPFVFRDLFRSKFYVVLLAIAFLGGMMVAVLAYVPTYAQTVFLMKPKAAALLLLHVGLGALLGAWLGGVMNDKSGARTALIVASAVVVVATLCMVVTVENKTIAKFTLVLLGVGLGALLGAPLQTVASQAGGLQGRAHSLSMMTAVGAAGLALGLLVFGAARGALKVGSFRNMFIALVINAFIVLVASMLSPKREEKAVC